MCTSVDIVWKSRAEKFGSSESCRAALTFPAIFAKFFSIIFLPKKILD
jgi:hypothetical protein